jgi:MOSC domain-containing protein YiiM
MSGRVEAIAIAIAAGEPLRPVERVEAIAGRGLAGDRYASEQGEFSDRSSGMRDVTLIAAEALEELSEGGVELAHLESRRNVLVRGVDVNSLVGRRFRLGPVECIGRELSEPCSYLEGLTRPGVLRGLVHRGGLRAGIVGGGILEVGDEVSELAD